MAIQRAVKIGIGMALSIFVILFVLTAYEYQLFCVHVARLRVLQEDYRGYIALISGLVDDPSDSSSLQTSSLESTSLPGADESLETDEEDSESDEAETDFLVVNRTTEYLRDAALAFYAQNNLQASAALLAAEWEPYNDWHLKQRELKDTVPRKKKKNVPCVPRSRAKRTSPALSRVSSGTARFVWPIDPAHFWLSSLYGPRKRKDGSLGFHHAIDMAALKGTRVKAAASGTVIEARYAAGWGNEVLIKHPDHNGRFKTRYAHLDKIHVYVGQEVTKDTWIGNVGSTGMVRKKGKDASHLHFEVYDRGKRVNPLPLLR